MRISILLTLVSAGLVSLALMGQVTDFADPFPRYAVAIISTTIALIGFMTRIRVRDLGMEDLMYALAMNRLRAAYLELDPGIRPYLMAAGSGGVAGMSRTYYFFDPARNRHRREHDALHRRGRLGTGRSAGGGAPHRGGRRELLAAGGAVLVALLYIGLSILQGGREYQRFWRSYEPLVPTPAGEPQPPRGRAT